MNKRKYLSLMVLALVVTGTACNKLKDFGDTNVNPNGAGIPIYSALLTNVLSGMPATATQTRGGLYCQYFSETQYTDVSLYSAPKLEFDATYSGPLADLQNVIDNSKNANMTAIARIVKAYNFWTLTDRWGDLPYGQALKGVKVPTPGYDKQEDIYKGIIAELKAANAQFNATDVVSGDISDYKGSTAGWKKAANSIRLLVALRMSKRFPGASELAATEIKAALADAAGVISTNANNLTFVFPGGNLASPWYNLYNGRKDFGESKTMTDLVTSLGDLRQGSFASDEQGNPSTTGVPYGWARNRVDPWTQANPKWTYILKKSLRDATGSVVVIPASVVALARAEAADRGWTTENAKTMYENGIKLSHEQWGVAAPADTYFTQSAVAFSAATGTGANLKQIATQRYLATFPDGLQGWSEWRRTGFPVLTPAPDATNSTKQIPRRYTYGNNEYGSNPESVKAAVTLLTGGDTPDSKFWWDK